MDEEKSEAIRQYKNQIIAVIFVILSLIISLFVLFDLIKIVRYGDKDNKLQKSTILRSEIASLIIVITTFYFAYLAYKTYKKSPTKANFTFLVASLLTLIAALMRFITIINSEDVEGIEDVI